MSKAPFTPNPMLLMKRSASRSFHPAMTNHVTGPCDTMVTQRTTLPTAALPHNRRSTLPALVARQICRGRRFIH